MSLRPFIKSHIKQIYIRFDYKKGPFDSYLREYYRDNKTLGPSERSIISQMIFKLIRHDVLLNHYTQDVERKLELLNHIKEYQNDQSLPLQDEIILNSQGMFDAVVPQSNLFQIISSQYGEQQAFEFCQSMNEKAPLTIRVNPIKTDREKLMRSMPKIICKKTTLSPYGLIVSQESNVNLIDTKQFKEGQFEIQDEASQVCALRVECKPQDKVLDYCVGSGGKTLAFAHRMEGKGLIEIHDIRKSALLKAKDRFKKAGIYNYQLFSKKYKYDWILLDVPCSGSGTLRRNPDMKYQITRERLGELVKLQQQIFKEAVVYLKDDGKIVYTTCSFLKNENQDQMNEFCKRYSLKISGGEYFQSLPESGGMDSFFSVTLERK